VQPIEHVKQWGNPVPLSCPWKDKAVQLYAWQVSWFGMNIGKQSGHRQYAPAHVSVAVDLR